MSDVLRLRLMLGSVYVMNLERSKLGINWDNLVAHRSFTVKEERFATFPGCASQQDSTHSIRANP